MTKPKKELKKATLTVKGKKCVLLEPDFKQLSFGLSALSAEGKMNMVEGGKAIYDVCMIDCDKEIKESGKLLMSICVKIAEGYLLPLEVTIKKN